MPDSFDLNNVPRSTDAIAQVPTSSSEVSIRTMASDLELMGESGGMVNQGGPQGIQVPVTLHPDTSVAAVPVTGAATGMAGLPDAPAAPQLQARPASGRGRHILITIIVILAVLGLFALGYFVIGGK